MAFALTDEQELVQRTIRELAQGPIAQAATRADREASFPRENVQRLAELGLLGVLVDEEQGGAGADALTFAVACEELGAVCSSTAAFVAMTNAWVTDLLASHGSVEAREDWLPRVLTGEALGTFAVHEDAMGADPSRIRTALHARDGDAGAGADDGAELGVLSGTKDLVLLAGSADLAMVAARERDQDGGRKIALWAVPTDRDGMKWGGDDPKLGLRGLPTAPLYLVRVGVKARDRVATPADTVAIMRRARQVFTIGTAAAAVGAARSALEGAVEFAQERKQFGSAIARYEAIQHAVAGMKTSVGAARAILLHAASLLDREREAPVAVETANIQVFEATRQATRTAIRVHGGAGFMRDLPIERYARDVRTLAVLGRSPEVSKSLVGMHELRLQE